MVSTMEMGVLKYFKIKQVINFDGPGFRYAEFNSRKYQILCKKLVNIVPSGSYIGVLLFNDKYKVISSKAIAISEHYPHTWRVNGNNLVESKLSNMSLQLQKNSVMLASNVDEEKFKIVVEAAFKDYENNLTSKINLSLTDVIKLFKNVKSTDSETSGYLHTIVSQMLDISKK